MKYRVTGLDRDSEDTREPIEVEANSQDEAIDIASSKGMMVESAHPVSTDRNTKGPRYHRVRQMLSFLARSCQTGCTVAILVFLVLIWLQLSEVSSIRSEVSSIQSDVSHWKAWGIEIDN